MDRATALEYCDTLLRHFPASLSEWEDSFVRDIRRMLQQGRLLSQRQQEALDGIMERCAEKYR